MTFSAGILLPLRLGEDEISAKFALADKMLTQQTSLCSLGFVR